jgi:hypothetical protein
MNGFLHRIAATALGSNPRVHPIVDPLYTSSRQPNLPNPPELHIEQIAQAHVAPPSSIASKSTDPGAAVALPADSPRDESQRRFWPHEPLIETRAERLTAAPAEAAEHFPRSGMAKAQQQDGSATEQPPELSRTHPAHGASNSPEVLIPRSEAGFRPAWGFVPIVVDNNAPEVASGPATNSGAQPFNRVGFKSAVGSARPIQKRDPALSNAAQAQTDDIQIHIGRIEVLAVSQPASRPAPPPARKGLSLDEYLRRRNGRAG